MASKALHSVYSNPQAVRPQSTPMQSGMTIRNCLFTRSPKKQLLRVVKRQGHYCLLDDGRMVYDGSGGAAVCSLSAYIKPVADAMKNQIDLGLTYVPSLGYETAAAADLAQFLVTSTNGKLSKAVFYSSGSEATEAALKIIVQYHSKEKITPEPSRTMFIARERSYHGATLGALDVSGHEARKVTFKDILGNNVSLINPCYPYRGQGDMSNQEYVEHLSKELDDEIKRLGPQNVAGFIMEPVVGAALGCVSAVEGYLKAMRKVCDQHGVILVFDEIMCGMGRTGYLHAWQKENVAPDVQLVGKGLAAGFGAMSGMMLGDKIVNAFENGSGNGVFNHGHTFENFSLGCAAALAAQKYIQDNNLLENVRVKGKVLGKKLKDRLDGHRYVGEIRGEGYFWGIEFVRDKQSKKPFLRKDGVAEGIHNKGLHKPAGGIYVYPGAGTYDGTHGDHILIAPAFDISDDEIDFLVNGVGLLIEEFFEDFVPSEE